MIDLLFIGTYSEPILFGTGEILQGQGQGIHLYGFNRETGEFSDLGLAIKSRNPSFIALSSDNKYLYAVNELKEYMGEKAGSVSAYRIDVDADLPKLTYLNTVSTLGTDPCHVNLNQSDAYVYVANFMSGSVSVHPVKEDGSLDVARQFIQHEGHGQDQWRQAGPHAHSVLFTPDEAYVLVPDLGIDKLMIYKTDFTDGMLTPANPPFFSLSPGEGPRYGEFHANKEFFYLINELASSLSIFHYAGQGAFERKQVISTIPEDFAGENNICADVHMAHNGRFVYASNRGHNSIAVFEVDDATGLLDRVEIVDCGGRTPRNFAVSPCGNYLIVGNQDSNNLVSFRIDQETGMLTKISDIDAPTPVCIRPFQAISRIIKQDLY